MNSKIVIDCSAALLVCLALAGCSLSESSSDSSASVFDMASSPLSASSGSSRTAQDKYQNEVADYTAEYVVSSTGSIEKFRAHLSDLAEQRGISNWEADHHTYIGIGKGLKKAQLGGPQTNAFVDSFSERDSMKKQAILDGLNQ